MQTIQVNARTRRLLDSFIQLVKSFQAKASTEDAYQAAIFIAKQSGLIDTLKGDTTIEGINRLENVNSLLDGIKEFVEGDELLNTEQQGGEKTLSSYIQSIALLTDLDDNSQGQDHVTLMSVHAAKGLEFPSIFVVGLEEKLFPSFMSMDTAEGLDEERRLFLCSDHPG